jgi:hypothetical protein
MNVRQVRGFGCLFRRDSRSMAVVLKVSDGWEGHRLLPIHPNKIKSFWLTNWCELVPVSNSSRTKDGQR